MSGWASDWLIDTFFYTAALIALVLLVRRPVARYFGPQIAYALWALPLLRFLMPPITLPASMAPVVAEPDHSPGVSMGEPIVIYVSDLTAPEAPGFAVIDLLVPVWLIGGALFLAWRLRTYLQMRDSLLAEARPVGEAGKVRLVETRAVTAPVAFGLTDKVVALPPGFISHHDITARDLAIAHELAHHRGRDLLANVAAQPLLALHWFSPLAWWGWRAMRRDQEAACDARVVAGRARSERAVYAQVIAGFAAGEKLALAAPMACPVLGEKSIIHRLRSLTMSDVSTTRRRLGIAALATTALALPLTATISYAQPEIAEIPELPSVAAVPQMPPQMPEVPAMPEMPQVGEAGARRVFVQRIGGEQEGAPAIRRLEVQRLRDAPPRAPETRVLRLRDSAGEPFDEAEFEARMADWELEMEQFERDMEQFGRDMEHWGEEFADGETARAIAMVPEVIESCERGQVAAPGRSADGRPPIVICTRDIAAGATAGALSALQWARGAIARHPELSPEERRRALRDLEAQIDRLQEGEELSFAPAPHVEVHAVPHVPQVAHVARVARVERVVRVAGVAPAPRVAQAAPVRSMRSATRITVSVPTPARKSAPGSTILPAKQIRVQVAPAAQLSVSQDCEREESDQIV